ncbi:MAG: exodeoxyribonuclease V subunit beta [Neisseriaceae bacterium]|nr:exodeoxyribonuclease V subunit beta [Neisseriaceae bacterium]
MNSHLPQSFDALTMPIDGTSLIEASAGTGKTYGIALLFTRLILLENIKIDKIAVLTFTVAATAELKMRLRSRLIDVKNQLSNGQFPDNQTLDDKNLIQLFNLAKNKDITASILLKNAQDALNNFDQAGIYTIHAFCRSILNEEAFACGVPFSLQMQTTDDDNELKQKLAEDFWRQYIANNQLAAFICFNEKITPEKKLDEIKKYISQPKLNKESISFEECIGEVEKAQEKLFRLPEIKISDDLIAQIKENFNDKEQDLFYSLQQRIQQIGTNHIEVQFWQIFNRLSGTYYKKPTFVEIFNNLQKIIQGYPFNMEKIAEKAHLLLPENFIFTKNKSIDNLSPFEDFRLIYYFVLSYQNFTQNIGFFLLDYLDNEITQSKKSSNKRGFNDLLLDVYFSLENKILTKHLSKKYDVLMVDEFQDTDAIQYAIFKQAFIEQGKSVFLVGDPKQAIYRFRGADIYAYLNAKQDADHLYSMDTNYRTHEKLVNVCNALFNTNNAFLNNEIPFFPVQANRKQEYLSGSLKQEILPNALTVFHIDESEKNTADEQRQKIAQICANHIARVLNSRLPYKERCLSSGDIAVLVRSHSEGDIIRKALKNNGIDSVSIRQDSIFAADEARIVYALMKFWLNPATDGSLWRFVQTSDLIGKNIQQIQEYNNNERQVVKDIEYAHFLREKWEKKGLFAAYQAFDERYQISRSLISRQEWRILTNITQLIELLAEEEKNCFGIYALLHFLQQQIAQPDSGDNSKLRLESDENLVKIITMHASKGLQYPVVYCPFIFRPHDEKVQAFEITHQNNHSGCLKHKTQLAEQEIQNDLLAEQVRLLYVALTRAEEALIVGCGDMAQQNSSINHLLRNSLNISPENKEITQWQMWQDKCQQNNDLSIQLVDSTQSPPETLFRQPATETQHYTAAQLSAINLKQRQFSSFSAWQTQTHNEENLVVDSVERQVSDDLSNENKGINAFPAGTNTGLCWHEMLEEFYFHLPADTQKYLIINKLEKYALSLDYLNDMVAMCNHTRLAALNHGVSLSQIPFRLPESQFLLNELHFQPEVVLQYLGDDLPENICTALRQVQQHTVQGFFNGFIDMLAQDAHGNVYIIDYKSNKLPSYDLDAMNNAMAQHHYAVQALIYAIATRRMFAIRNIHPTLLHIRYLFLRGLNKDNANGIWAWDIDCNILKKLENALSIHKIQAA